MLIHFLSNMYHIKKVYLAAESHVDRSISNPLDFIKKTNVIGTMNLLNSSVKYWKRFF